MIVKAAPRFATILCLLLCQNRLLPDIHKGHEPLVWQLIAHISDESKSLSGRIELTLAMPIGETDSMMKRTAQS